MLIGGTVETLKQFSDVLKFPIGAAISLFAVAGMAVTPCNNLSVNQIIVLVPAVFLSSASAGAFNQ